MTEKLEGSVELSKSWIMVNSEIKKAQDNNVPISSGVENVESLEKEQGDTSLDSDTDSISIISESDGCSHNGKSDEDDCVPTAAPTATATIPPVSQQVVVHNKEVVQIEAITNDYLQEKLKVKQLSIALAVVIISVLFAYYIEATNNYNIQFKNHNDKSHSKLDLFEPLNEHENKDTQNVANKKLGDHPQMRASQKISLDEHLRIKEEYLQEKEKFLIEKEHELLKKEQQINQIYEKIHEAHKKSENGQKEKKPENFSKKLNQSKTEQYKNPKKKKHFLPKQKDQTDEIDEKSEKYDFSGKWYTELHRARSDMRKKNSFISNFDYFSKYKRNKALWYFRRMFARERKRFRYE